MAQYVVRAPDGQTYDVNAPDGATEADAIAYVQQKMAGTAATRRKIDADPISKGAREFNNDAGFLRNAWTSFGGAAPKAIRGLRQLTEANPVEMKRLQDEEAQARKLNAPLDETIGGKVGGVLGDAALYATLMMLPGMNTVAGAALMGGLQGSAQPLVDGESRAGRAAVGAGVGGAMQWAVPKAAMALADRSFNSGQQQQQNLLRDSALRAMQAEGGVVPPSAGGGGWLSKRLESVAGKAAIKQEAQARNAEVIRRLAAQSVGLNPEDAITTGALRQVRESAGRAGYGPIDRMGTVNWTPEYVDALESISRRIGKSDARVASLRNQDVINLADELNVTQMTGRELNALIKDLRETGNKAASSAYGLDPAKRALGKAQVQSAHALEDLASQNLALQGRQDLIPGMLSAREQIAKAHTVEKALNPATGGISPKPFADRVAKNLPITGEQRTIGEFAAAFPQFVRAAEMVPAPGVSALEATAAPIMAGIGGAGGGPAGLLAGGLPLLRSPVRNMLLSPAYQQLFVQPRYPHSLMGITPGMLDSELSQLLGRTLGPTAAQGLLTSN